MELMRSNVFLLMLAGILFIGLFSGNIIEMCTAEDEHYKISMDVSSEFVKATESGGKTWTFFNITVALYNSGNVKSDDITVKLQDEDANYTRKGSVMPGENKTFVFVEHPLLGLGEHKIDISYYPTDLTVKTNNDNSGSTTFTVGYDNDDDGTSTPGFEFIFIILAVAFVLLIRKKIKHIY